MFDLPEQDDHELFEISSSDRRRAVQAQDFDPKQSYSMNFTLSDGKGLNARGAR